MQVELEDSEQYNIKLKKSFETIQNDENLLCLQCLDEETVIIGSKDKRLVMYNLEKESVIDILEGHNAGVCCLSIC
jgi:hypothetical protein